MKKRTFEQFSSEIEKLSKTEEGKLKGGFNSMSSQESSVAPGNNGKGCTCNTHSGCSKKLESL
jgi:hypothetical protein